MICGLTACKWWPVCSLLVYLISETQGVAGTALASNNGVLFACSFTMNTCGMINQASAHWRREFLSIGGRHGYAMVVKGNAANNRFARFLTPDISAEGSTAACLRFLYFIDGRTPASLSVIKQGLVTKYLFGSARKTADHWKKAEVDVEFLGDNAMFYFEADTRVQDYGDSIVAFSDITISTHSCQQKRRIG